MKYVDYYKVFDLPRDATTSEIKKAYRKLARKYHPDVTKDPQGEAKFKELGEAYAVLKDPEKRAAYDQLGSGWTSGEDFQPPPNWDAGFEFRGKPQSAAGESISDLFEHLFGERGPQYSAQREGARSTRGEDHHAKVELTVLDSIQGGVRSMTLNVPEYDATGHIRLRSRTLRVRVPKGVTAGQQIRLSGQGGPGFGGGAPGDLYLQVEFADDELYAVDGRNLMLKLPVTPWELMLGAKVRVPTPTGEVEMTIPENSQAGRQLRLKGKGLPGDPTGDLLLRLEPVVMPPSSTRARELFETMRDELDFNPREKLRERS